MERRGAGEADGAGTQAAFTPEEQGDRGMPASIPDLGGAKRFEKNLSEPAPRCPLEREAAPCLEDMGGATEAAQCRATGSEA